MNTFRIFFLFLIFIISNTVHAQSHTEQQNSSFGKGRIKTSEGNKIYFSSITLGQDVHTYLPNGSNLSQTIVVTEVQKIEVQKGSYALGIGVVSAILGFFGSIEFLKSWGDEMVYPDEMESNVFIPIMLGSTAGSALIGALIGSRIKKYKTVYTNPEEFIY